MGRTIKTSGQEGGVERGGLRTTLAEFGNSTWAGVGGWGRDQGEREG